MLPLPRLSCCQKVNYTPRTDAKRLSSMNYLRTSDLAKAVGVHPNTVRRYVDRGLLPAVLRSNAVVEPLEERGRTGRCTVAAGIEREKHPSEESSHLWGKIARLTGRED